MKGLARFSLLRLASLLICVVIAVYVTILIANMGGAVDEIRKAMIRVWASEYMKNNPDFQLLPPDEYQRLEEELVRQRMEAEGLHRPFLVRTFYYLKNAVTLDLGRSKYILSPSKSAEVRRILLERLPQTLLLFGTTELFLFFISLFIAVFLSRRYGSFLDRLVIGLAPSSAAPGWFYGIFLIMIFAIWAGQLGLPALPSGGYVDVPPPEGRMEFALSVLKHMVLPVAAMVIGSIFASIYGWRTFFLIYSSDDHVELAKAKGLGSRTIERRYILRPTLPMIITSFMLMVITMWMGAIILERIFRWPGLGSLLYSAIGHSCTPTIVGTVVVYGYLLAGTVFLLDFIYGIVDPRIRVVPTAGGRE